MTEVSRYLLILACSQRKRSDPGLLPAIERYDGPAFRVLRRFLNQNLSEFLDISVYILSAEFGLIPGDRPIPDYNRRMTKLRAKELQPTVIKQIKDILNSSYYQKLLICVGRDYLAALEGYNQVILKELTVQIATGGLGQKLSILYQWLYGKPAKSNDHKFPNFAKGEATIKGVKIKMTPTEVMSLAQKALAEGKGQSSSYQSWYVLINEQKVGPKWLVSQLTNLSVSAFQTSDALRVLAQLGIKVYHLYQK